MNLAAQLERLHARAVLLGSSESPALSPVTLAAHAGFTLDAWQRDVLTSTAHQIILLGLRSK